MVRGRAFNDSDGTPGHEARIVNQRFVAMHFPGEDPLGRRIRSGRRGAAAVTTRRRRSTRRSSASCRTSGSATFTEPDPDPVVYVPYRADPQRFVFLVVRGQRRSRRRITPLVREEMRVVEPDLPLFDIQTMDAAAGAACGCRSASSVDVRDLRRDRAGAVGGRPLRGDRVLRVAADAGDRHPHGARRAAETGAVAGAAPIAVAARDRLPIGVAGAFGVGRLLQSLLVQTSAPRSADDWGDRGGDDRRVGRRLLLAGAPATRLDPVIALRYE